MVFVSDRIFTITGDGNYLTTNKIDHFREYLVIRSIAAENPVHSRRRE